MCKPNISKFVNGITSNYNFWKVVIVDWSGLIQVRHLIDPIIILWRI
jgi:hypothetical protein